MYSSETSEVIKFMFPNLASNSGELAFDLRSLPPKACGYFGSGTLKPPSDDAILLFWTYEEQHIMPKTTARKKYPLLWIEF
jgi:hypothetical protein